MWDEVLTLLIGRLRDDAVLEEIFGEEIVRSGERPHTVPSMVFTLLADEEVESQNPIDLQVDLFVDDYSDLVTADRRMRSILDRKTQVAVGGVRMLAEMSGGAGIEGPDSEGVIRRLYTGQFTPTSRRYRRP